MKGGPLLLLAIAAFSGCAELLQGEGEETLVVRNADAQPVEVLLVIDQAEGGVRVFGRDMFLERGEEREYPVSMRPGEYVARVTTSTRLQETLPLEIPARGDTRLTFQVDRGSAALTVTH